ncbi:MAG: hypothetical protein PHQ28_00820 [Mycobacterium sp.]|nr:hypothetical protein [Mycobacterium sp.]
MLIPVQVVAELFSADQCTDEHVAEALSALNQELREHFSGIGEVVGIPSEGSDNVTKVDTVAKQDRPDVVVATLVLALRNISASAALAAAQGFASTRFPSAVLTPFSESQLDRLRGLGAFADAAATVKDTAATSIINIAKE